MTHNDIIEAFKDRFPGSVEDIETIFQNGKNSIRVRFTNKNEFVFTYYDNSTWCLETVKHHLERKFNLKGEN